MAFRGLTNDGVFSAAMKKNSWRFLSVRSVFAVLACMVVLAAQAWAPSTDAAELPSIALAELPVEARMTLDLIRRGGPFPYRRDGVVFQNRESRLPARQKGYYREYTVPTPGSRDRGARRIVSGARNEYYYSADHYRSFQRIKP